MFARKRIPFWPLFAGLLTLGLLTVGAVPAPIRGEENSREQQIAEIQKQIQDLQKKLEELRKQETVETKVSVSGTLPDDWVKKLEWRCIGPANMGGRITALAVYEKDPSLWWVATASGGLLKTTNNGVTFEHQFDREATVSIGDVAVAQSNKDIVWVGTGENNPRNSVSFGDGVYKSTDGGKTWKNMGLKESFQIGKVVIHPTNPDIVYVGALGRLYGPNAERGLFKTTDGGNTWEKILFLDENTGIIDLQMHPTDPQTLLAAAWERRRDQFDSHPGDAPMEDGYDGYDPIKKWGPNAGIYKTTDGGKSWKKMTKGLPTCHLGRIGIDYYRKDPNIIFAIVDSANIGKGTPPSPTYLGVQGEDAEGGKGAKLLAITENSPAARAGLQAGDIVRAIEKKPIKSYDELASAIRERKPDDKMALTVLRGDETKEITVTLGRRGDRGRGRNVPARFLAGFQGEDTKDGVRIERLFREGSAERAGLKEGDVIQSVGGAKVTTMDQFVEKIAEREEGDKLKLKVLRDKETKDVEFEITRPERFGRRPSGVYAGFQGEQIEGGIKVTQVVPEGPAAKAGVKPEDVIKAVDKTAVTTLRQVQDALRDKKAGDKVTFQVLRGTETKDLPVTLADRPAPTRTRPWGAYYAGQRENIQNEQGPNSHEYGGIYRSDDGGESWKRVNSFNPRPMYFSLIRVDPSNDKHLYVGGIQLHRSSDGGKTIKNDGGRGVHADHHALWIDPSDGRHMILGTDGGVYVTYDRMDHWDHHNHVAMAQFYHVCVDTRQPYRVYGGLQDNGSWGGPSRSLRGRGGPSNDEWYTIGGGDGFVCRVDPDDPDLIYYESQGGVMRRRNIRTGEGGSIRPRAGRGEPEYRFNWNTPYILSSHNPRIFYCAGNYVFRSFNRGEDIKPISPEITRTPRGSGTAVAESPRDPDVLYAGTDDGLLWVTRDGGKNWKNVTANVGLPGPRWVATIEPSRYETGRAYVVFDGHRSDDDDPYVYVTEDYGETWKSLRANLPTETTRVLREDVANEDLLYLGTEFNVYASLNRGQSWAKINNNLPTVAVHEIAIHPTAGEIVAATHGRSLWVLDVSALRQMKPDLFAKGAALYRPQTVVRWRSEPSTGSMYGNGSKRFEGEDPPAGAHIYYSLGEKADKLDLKVLDYAGNTVAELRASSEPGLHIVNWNLTRRESRRDGEGGRGRRGRARAVPSGIYRVVLSVNGEQQSHPLRIEPDPTLPATIITENLEEFPEEEEKEGGKWRIDD